MAPRTDVLLKGSCCNNTLACQAALNIAQAYDPSLKLGAPLVLDGIFGNKTDAAVRQLQTKLRMQYVDGIIGEETAGHLFQWGDYVTHVIVQTPNGLPQPVRSGPGGMAINAPKGPPLPKPPAPPSLPSMPNLQLTDPTKAADTASLLMRERTLQAFQNTPRMEDLKLALPKLPLFKAGIDPATLTFSGVVRELVKIVPGGTQIYNAVTGEKQSLWVQMETKDFSTYTFRYASTAPIAQPRPLPYFRSESKTEIGPDGISMTHLTSWQSVTPVISFADRLKLQGSASLYAGVFAAWKMGAPTAGGEFGLKAQADAALRVVKKPVPGPFGTSIDAIDLSISGGYGVSGSFMLSPSGLSADTMHGPFGGISITGLFSHDPKR